MTESPQARLRWAPAQLCYAATARCRCGAGLAYPFEQERRATAWECSALLTAGNDPEWGDRSLNPADHDEAKPFIFWKIKGENQPSANGATTRPAEPDGQRQMYAEISEQNRLRAMVAAHGKAVAHARKLLMALKAACWEAHRAGLISESDVVTLVNRAENE